LFAGSPLALFAAASLAVFVVAAAIAVSSTRRTARSAADR